MQLCFEYKVLKGLMKQRNRHRRLDHIVFVAVGDTAARVFPQLTGLRTNESLELPHYCMWHRGISDEDILRITDVITLIHGDEGSGKNDSITEQRTGVVVSRMRERISSIASKYASLTVTDDFKYFFRNHAWSDEHRANHADAIRNPSEKTRAAQSTNMTRLKADPEFSTQCAEGARKSTKLSSSSSSRMKEAAATKRAITGKRKFCGADGSEAACPWCSDKTLSSEGQYPNGRLLCGTCSLSCYICEDRTGVEIHTPQSRVWEQMKKKVQSASIHKRPKLEQALERLRNTLPASVTTPT